MSQNSTSTEVSSRYPTSISASQPHKICDQPCLTAVIAEKLCFLPRNTALRVMFGLLTRPVFQTIQLHTLVPLNLVICLFQHLQLSSEVTVCRLDTIQSLPKAHHNVYFAHTINCIHQNYSLTNYFVQAAKRCFVIKKPLSLQPSIFNETS